eukprot:947151-Prymnesium_polylepis.1
MVDDLKVFFLLMGSVLWPLTVGFVGLSRISYYESGVQKEAGTIFHPRAELSLAFWSALGAVQDDQLDQLAYDESTGAEFDSAVWAANVLVLVSIFVGSVVLVNRVCGQKSKPGATHH